jgi:hypothetical protein
MIKGVNKQIIEINNTDDEIFEKVVFYINPEFSNSQCAELEKKAKKYIKETFTEKKQKMTSKWKLGGWDF